MEMSEAEREERVAELQKKASELLARVESLKEQLDHPEGGGYGKLVSKIEAEKSFVSSLLEKDTPVKENSFRSTNLIHLEALTYTAEHVGHVTRVMCPFKFLTKDQDKINIIVDVIGQDGKSWVKVTARNAEALHRTWLDGGDYGDHDIVQQVQFYQLASQQNPVEFTAPSVHVVFYNGVTQDIVEYQLIASQQNSVEFTAPTINVTQNIEPDELSELGVTVYGHIFKDAEEARTGSPSLPVFPLPDVEELTTSNYESSGKTLVNLDVTTLIALVSELSHGGCHFKFKESYIEDLAQQERIKAFLPPMESFLEDKDLIVCKTALRDFQNILKTIAGPKELRRAKKLLKRVQVVEDQLSRRAEFLTESNRIKRNSKVTFGTGDALGAITTTGNISFIKAAKRKGVTFYVYTHQSRALTEKKQTNPEKVHNPESPKNGLSSLYNDNAFVEVADRDSMLACEISVDLHESSLRKKLSKGGEEDDAESLDSQSETSIRNGIERAPSLDEVMAKTTLVDAI